MSQTLFNPQDQDHRTGGTYDRPGNESTGVGTADAKAEAARLEEQFGMPSAPDASYGNKSSSPESLDGQEKDASDPAKSTDASDDDEDTGSTDGKKTGKFRLGISKKKAGIAGLLASMLVGGGLGLTSISGPASFVALAENVSHAHLAAQNDQSTSRFTKMVRYLYYKNKNKVYKTKLTGLSNHFADKIDARFAKEGVSFDRTGFGGATKAMIIDAENNKDLAGKTTEEQLKTINEKYGGAVAEVETSKDGKNTFRINFNADGNKGGRFNYSQERKIFFATGDNVGEFGKLGFIANRLGAARAGFASIWHPFSKSKAASLSKIADQPGRFKEWAKDKAKTIYGNSNTPAQSTVKEKDPASTSPQDPSTEAAGQASADSAQGSADATSAEGAATGTAIAEGDRTAAPKAADNIKSKLSAGKLAGGTALVVGVLCLLRGIDHNGDTIKQAQVVEPLVGSGLDALATASEIKNGTDVNPVQMQQASKLLWDPVTKSTPFDSAVLRSDAGESTQSVADGMQPSKTLSTITANTPFHFLNEDPFGFILKPVCGFLSNTVVSFFTTVLGSLSFSGIAQSVGLAVFAQEAAQWVASKPVDIFAAGADYGNNVDYGVLLHANQQAIANGGTVLGTAQVAELQRGVDAKQKSEFSQQSLAYKIFNPYDSQTLMSHVLTSTTPSMTANITRVGSALTTGLGHTFANTFQTVFGGTALAAAADTTPFNYNIPIYGFSQGDMDNTAVENPYQNADDVAAVLTPNGDPGHDKAAQTYISKASSCFQVNLVNTPDTSDTSGASNMVWDVQGNNDTTKTAIYGGDYQQTNSACADNGNTDWLKVRFFIFDTNVMKSATCYEGDDSSCTDLGWGSTDSASGGSASGGLGISSDGFVFPEKTTKTKIKVGSSINGQTLVWCYTSQTNCHHDYNAADVFGPTGTPVVAVHDGSIVYEVGDASGGTGSFVILKTNPDTTGQAYIFYYGHLGAGSIKVTSGQTVKAGDELGAIGTAADAEGTSPHLHIDAQSAPPATTREPCTNTACASPPFNFLNLQPALVKAYNALPD